MEAARRTASMLTARRRRDHPTDTEAQHDRLELAEHDLRVSELQLEMARDVNKMLVATLETYRRELADLMARVDILETKLRASDAEQDRLKKLLRHAVSVLRDFLEVAADHNIPAPEMSDDLKAEIERG
ncbi:hypothetical protein F5X71_34545 [Nocardia brasiliensis]|uniref:Uncharacterized protein n=1 Tax=Nocardia brasiliensis TaxID=37326 RepID=A0A6G9Y0Z7_NOCBR|nr:hypothetical protein [Nocardia brasiliensis]QIS06747.1 hypothetical protein F5X71_34545 [Nocardia brasiliensis]